MELENTIMNKRQRAYREEYRRRVTGWYNGWIHVGIIGVSGIAAIYIYIANLANVLAWEWIALPLGFVGYQLVEYVLHAYVMHRPRKNIIFRTLYIRHTLMHHQFFTEDEMRFADHKDWRVTFFPPFTMIVLTLLSVVPSLISGWIISANFGWLLLMGVTASYMFYELIHFCCHIEQNWFTRNIPLVNTAVRHHTAHHDFSKMMTKNMGIGTPFFDWMFGTSDLDRGFWGHMFNGHNTRYIKQKSK